MTTQNMTRSYNEWIGRDAFDRNGDKVGEIEEVYYDDATGRPEWLAVKTGWFGMKTSFVPIVGSAQRGDGITLTCDKDLIKAAPREDHSDGHLTPGQERELYAHYGFNWDEADPSGYGYGAEYAAERADREFAERLRFDTQTGTAERRYQQGQARLRRYEYPGRTDDALLDPDR
jgi:hypothetical protein